MDVHLWSLRCSARVGKGVAQTGRGANESAGKWGKKKQKNLLLNVTEGHSQDKNQTFGGKNRSSLGLMESK